MPLRCAARVARCAWGAIEGHECPPLLARQRLPRHPRPTRLEQPGEPRQPSWAYAGSLRLPPKRGAPGKLPPPGAPSRLSPKTHPVDRVLNTSTQGESKGWPWGSWIRETWVFALRGGRDSVLKAGLRRSQRQALGWQGVDFATGVIKFEGLWDQKKGLIGPKSFAVHGA